MLELLCSSVRIDSISGQEGPFVRFICNWAKQHGFETDLWETNEAELSHYAEAKQAYIPLSGRPTLVLRIPSQGDGRSLIFNAHSDVVPAGEIKNWSTNPWGGEYRDGRIYGRGACDAKGALIGALWAMLAIKENFQQELKGDILLELIPGEENCIGPGTLTSIARGYRADAAIVLEPTDNLPRCASRGGIRFEIRCFGKAAHGTAKWLGTDAIQRMRKVLDALEILEKRWNDCTSDTLFSGYPITRPITVDCIQGGEWRGMVCDLCRCEGYLELLPDDNREDWKRKFTDFLQVQTGRDEVSVAFGEEYAGHRTAIDNPFCIAAEAIIKKSIDEEQVERLRWDGWAGFNSGCEAGLRMKLQNTPTLVWGPGSLSEAHRMDEFVNFRDIEIFAGLMVKLAVGWSQMPIEYKK
jgi:acetylornithine deacetylase